jgi:hypothetical protein
MLNWNVYALEYNRIDAGKFLCDAFPSQSHWAKKKVVIYFHAV